MSEIKQNLLIQEEDLMNESSSLNDVAEYSTTEVVISEDTAIVYETLPQNDVPDAELFTDEEIQQLLKDEQQAIEEEQTKKTAEKEAEEQQPEEEITTMGVTEEQKYSVNSDAAFSEEERSEIVISDEEDNSSADKDADNSFISDPFGGGVSFVDENSNIKEENKNDVTEEKKPQIKYFNYKAIFAGVFVVVILMVSFVFVKQFAKPLFAKKNTALSVPPERTRVNYTPSVTEGGSNPLRDIEEEAINNQNKRNWSDASSPDANVNTENQQQNGSLEQGQNNVSSGVQNNELSPTSGGTDVSQDPVYQQKMALKTQYLELVKQSYLSKPSIDGGNWTGNKNQNNTSQQAGTADFLQNSAEAALKRAEQIAGLGRKFTESADINKAAASYKDGLQKNSKEDFFSSSSGRNGYLNNTRTEKISPYTLPSGTMIPCALITGINSDLPGNITASVTENVYDWQSAHVCLIPQGSRLFGKYSSSVAFGQKRAQISWERLIFPDGSTLNLENMPGVDRRGYSGLKDKAFNHYGKMFVTAVMTTAFSLLPALVENNRNNQNNTYYGSSVRDTAASMAAQNIGQMGNKFFDKASNVQPTIVIRPGTRFNVQVNADIPFYKKWSVVRSR